MDIPNCTKVFYEQSLWKKLLEFDRSPALTKNIDY